MCAGVGWGTAQRGGLGDSRTQRGTVVQAVGLRKSSALNPPGVPVNAAFVLGVSVRPCLQVCSQHWHPWELAESHALAQTSGTRAALSQVPWGIRASEDLLWNSTAGTGKSPLASNLPPPSGGAGEAVSFASRSSSSSFQHHSS